MVVGFCGLRHAGGLCWWGLWCRFFSCCRSRSGPVLPGRGCGCVWWFENSIVCTVLLAMGRIRVGVACGS